MQCKVVSTEFDLKSIDSDKTIFEVIHTEKEGKLNIIFDEDIYVPADTDFLERIEAITTHFQYSVLRVATKMRLQFVINDLIQEFFNRGLLSTKKWFYENYIHLKKDDMFEEYDKVEIR